MSEVWLFLIGVVIFAVAFTGSLTYAYLLAIGRYDTDLANTHDVSAAGSPHRDDLI